MILVSVESEPGRALKFDTVECLQNLCNLQLQSRLVPCPGIHQQRRLFTSWFRKPGMPGFPSTEWSAALSISSTAVTGAAFNAATARQAVSISGNIMSEVALKGDRAGCDSLFGNKPSVPSDPIIQVLQDIQRIFVVNQCIQTIAGGVLQAVLVRIRPASSLLPRVRSPNSSRRCSNSPWLTLNASTLCSRRVSSGFHQRE